MRLPYKMEDITEKLNRRMLCKKPLNSGQIVPEKILEYGCAKYLRSSKDVVSEL